jgi:hypothetical protein
MTVAAKVEVQEIAYQQILLEDGSVFSVQWLEVPGCFAQLISASLLLERYLKHVRDCTWSLVRPVINEEGIQFRLVGTSLAFLSFAPPEYHVTGENQAVHLRNVGGLLVKGRQPAGGVLSLLTHREEGRLRVTLQLLYSRPLLLGSGTPSRLRRLFFSMTQGYLHRILTICYLKRLYRDLTGDEARFRVRGVRVREGVDI